MAEDIDFKGSALQIPSVSHRSAWQKLEASISQAEPLAAEQAIGALASEVMINNRIHAIGSIATSQLLLQRATRQPVDPSTVRGAYLSLAGAIVEVRATPRLDEGNRNGILSELLFMALVNRSGTIAACAASPREESSIYTEYNHDCVIVNDFGKKAFSIKTSAHGKRASHPVATVRMDKSLEHAFYKLPPPLQGKSDLYLLKPTAQTILDKTAQLVVRDALSPFLQSPTERAMVDTLTESFLTQVADTPAIVD